MPAFLHLECIPSTIPTRGTDDTAMNYYIDVVDAELYISIAKVSITPT